jgi:vitamin B12 transporter
VGWEGLKNPDKPEDLPPVITIIAFGVKRSGLIWPDHHTVNIDCFPGTASTIRKVCGYHILLNHKFLQTMRKWITAGAFCLLATWLFSQNTNQNEEPVLLEGVVIEASRMQAKVGDVPQKIEVITREQLQSIPSENLAEILKRTTNLDIIQYPGLSADIGMRGFSPSAHSRSYTLLLLDGKPMATSNFAALSTQNIERIEVIKGPYAVLYGSDAMAGVINVVTKNPAHQPLVSAGVQAGSFGYARFEATTAAAINDELSFSFELSRQQQQKEYRIGRRNILNLEDYEKHIHDLQSYGDTMNNSGYKSHQAGMGLSWNPVGNWRVNTKAFYFTADDVKVPGNYWGSYGQILKDIERVNVYADVERITQNNRLTFSPYFGRENNPYYSDTSAARFIDFQSSVKEYGLKIHDLQRWNNLDLLVGMDLDVQDYQSERFKAEGESTNPYRPNHSNTKTAAFSQITYRYDNLLVNAGGRFDLIKYKLGANAMLESETANETYYTFNPSVGAQYRLLPGMRVRSSLGTAFSVPDAFKVAGYYKISEYFAAWDFWWIKEYVGNPELGPETSATFDFGWNWSSDKGIFEIDLAYFNTLHKDKIVETTTTDGKTTFENANRARMEGLEVMLNYDLGAHLPGNYRLMPYAGFTYMLKTSMENQVKDANGNVTTLVQDMLNVRKSNGSFGIVLDNRKQFSTRLNARYIGNRLEKDGFSQLRPLITSENYFTEGGWSAYDKVLEHPHYIILDYSVHYTLMRNFRLGLSVANLLDENYTEKDGYNMPGRQFIGSLAFRW